MSDIAPSPRERWFLTGLFGAALLLHFFCATQNWTTPFMPGHEFRQAQTAIVSYYIDQQNNFSLLYETPILGKPWVSILLEVPLYEWSVVGLSRATGIPHYEAARTISLACFYLTLPAVYLLLGRFALARPRRLLVLSLVLTCPVYIFYSRAFLMESMELMCCAWFLLGFVHTVDERRWSWLALAIVAGTGAALIKSSTLAVWLLPAAGYGVWLLRRDLQNRTGWGVTVRTLLWGAGTVVVPLAALRWWIGLTDPLKAAHASAWIFTSKNLSQGNWGLLDFTARFSPKVWGTLIERWQDAIMAPWIVIVGLIAGLSVVGAVRGRVLGCAAVFFLAQLMFPFAYAYQDYYYYACAIFLVVAFGFVLVGVLDSRLPRWSCGLIIAVPIVAQLSNYWHGYRPSQLVKSIGGFNYTVALNDIAPKDAVFVIAGADWSAIVPFYAQRKALMIRNGLEFDHAYLDRAFADLAGENVCALILIGPLRTNHALLDFAAEKFDLDTTTPTFSQGLTDVYFSRPYIGGFQSRLLASKNRYPEIAFTPRAEEKLAQGALKITAAVARSSFANISPAPFQARFAYGFDHLTADGDDVLSAHPACDLWVRPSGSARRIRWDFGIFPGAYERTGDKTDGVEFSVTAETPDGHQRTVYRRLLDPVNKPADRGRQHEVIPYEPLRGEVLLFSNRPNKSDAFDWSYWAKIEVR